MQTFDQRIAQGLVQSFAQRIARWQRTHGRRGLPWQGTRNPYRVWLSEIMLQQTQVGTVIDYYTRFIQRFADVQALAAASADEVMPYWAGLGYYARARNLHRCAQLVCSEWAGQFPLDVQSLQTLPGIGRSTAAAIAAFCGGQRTPILDGNVKRVFARCFGITQYPGLRTVEQQLWQLAETLVQHAPPDLDMAAYTQGLMDLGASVCTRGKPQCRACPLVADCAAHANQTQHLLPAPKPRRALPERHCHVLILHTPQAVLLERRPPHGIWGGLWTLPQFEAQTELFHFCQHQGLACTEAQRMAAFSHTFTHFRLHITPWLLPCSSHGHRSPTLAEPLPVYGKDRDETSCAWTRWDALGDTALPAPIKKLLAGLGSDRPWR